MNDITKTTSNNLENAVLGAIICCKGAILKVIGDLNPLYFTSPFTKTVCQQLLDMYNENLDIDLRSVGGFLPAMASVAGIDKQDLHFRLVNLIDGIYSDAHIETHMLQIKEQYVKTELATTLMEGMKSLNEESSVTVIADLQDKTVKLLDHKAVAFTLDHDDFIKQIVGALSPKFDDIQAQIDTMKGEFSEFKDEPATDKIRNNINALNKAEHNVADARMKTILELRKQSMNKLK